MHLFFFVTLSIKLFSDGEVIDLYLVVFLRSINVRVVQLSSKKKKKIG